MIELKNWTIDQVGWSKEEELQAEQQMTFSNGYLCQNAHLEEHYSGPTQPRTFIRGIDSPIPLISTVSIRLHDERLDLSTWKVEEFVRILHRNEPLLERQFIATSPKGNRLKVAVTRRLSTSQENTLEIAYAVTSLNYNGPISILPLIGGDDTPDWYPLMNQVGDKDCWMWLQMQAMDIQLCCAMKYQLQFNNEGISPRPIKVDKQRIIGYSHTLPILSGESYTLYKKVVVMDSRQLPKDQLIDQTKACLINV